MLETVRSEQSSTAIRPMLAHASGTTAPLEKTMDTPAASPLSRRSQPRLAWEHPVSVCWLGSDGTRGPWITALAEDISTGGMALTGRMNFAPGAVGLVELPIDNGQRAVVGFRVVHTHRVDPETASAGVKFTRLPGTMVEGRLRPGVTHGHTAS